VRKFARDFRPLPSWKDLETKKNRRQKISGPHTLETVSTVRIAVLIFVVASVFTLYIGHVHSTQNILAKLQTLQTHGDQLKLELNSVKGEYDRLTGPAVINRRATLIGLVPGSQFAGTIKVKANPNRWTQ
jgi:hypothetical protein